MALLIFYLSMDQLMAIAGLDVTAAMSQSVRILMMAILIMSAATVIIAAVDIPFQIHSYREKLKMTMQQVKDEMKDTEGRPEVKQRVRQLQYQMTQNRMMSALPQADVVITNPTHYAVALKYDRDRQGGAPVLIAKGVDMMAMKIREVANKHEIAIVESPMLARAIYYHTKLEQEIPEGLFKAVAQVLAYVFQLKAFQRGQAKRPFLPSELPIPDDLQRDARQQTSE
jgi:flagellar biosynthetic protein FlhB